METSQALSIRESALSCLERARTIKVRSEIELVDANDFLRAIKGIRKQIDDTCDLVIKSIHETHKKAVEQKKQFEAPVIEAERIIKGAMGAYAVEQEKARKKEREEAERRLLESAAKAENEGKQDLAEAIIEHGPQAMPEAEKPKLEGTSIRMITKWRLINLDIVPPQYLKTILNTDKVEIDFKKYKGKMRIPGIETYEEPSIASRA